MKEGNNLFLILYTHDKGAIVNWDSHSIIYCLILHNNKGNNL